MCVLRIDVDCAKPYTCLGHLPYFVIFFLVCLVCWKCRLQVLNRKCLPMLHLFDICSLRSCRSGDVPRTTQSCIIYCLVTIWRDVRLYFQGSAFSSRIQHVGGSSWCILVQACHLRLEVVPPIYSTKPACLADRVRAFTPERSSKAVCRA